MNMGYKVGDKIKIKEWDDMEKEFGLDFYGDIKCKCTFVKNMKKYCGKTLEISEITLSGNYIVEESFFTFSDDMIVKEDKMDNFKIKVTKKDLDAVLKKMESNGIVWKYGAEKPTKYRINYSTIYLYVTNNKLIWGHTSENFAKDKLKEITVSEYLNRKSEHIIIYRNGNSVIAKDRSTGKNAVAKCHPDDEFDFMVGAKLALERLSQPNEPKYYNGKVVCVKSFIPSFTVGKIYEVKDGQFKDDAGDVLPIDNERIKSFEDFNEHFMSSFIQIVE